MTNNILDIMEELKQRGYVSKKFKAKQSNSVFSFRSSMLKRNEITYNPHFANSDKDCLRFIILHELGHKGLQFSHIALISSFLISVFGYAIVKFLIGNNILSILINWITGPIIFIIVFRLWMPFLRIDEFKADKFAAKILIEGYKQKGIDKTLEESFKLVADDNRKPNTILKYLSYVYDLFPYHPTREERIERIRSYERSFS